MPVIYYNQKAKYILRKKVRPSGTYRNRSDKIKPIHFIIFCAKEKINLNENLFWQKINPINLYIIANPFFLKFTFLTTKPKKANSDKRKTSFMQFAVDYRRLVSKVQHQIELEVECENFDPTNYIHEIDIKEEPLDSALICHPHQLQIKEEPL